LQNVLSPTKQHFFERAVLSKTAISGQISVWNNISSF